MKSVSIIIVIIFAWTNCYAALPDKLAPQSFFEETRAPSPPTDSGFALPGSAIYLSFIVSAVVICGVVFLWNPVLALFIAGVATMVFAKASEIIEDRNELGTVVTFLRTGRYGLIKGIGGRAVPVLRSELSRTKDVDKYLQILEILGDIGTRGAVEALVEGLRNNNRFIRAKSAEVLIRLLRNGRFSYSRDDESFMDIHTYKDAFDMLYAYTLIGYIDGEDVSKNIIWQYVMRMGESAKKALEAAGSDEDREIRTMAWNILRNEVGVKGDGELTILVSQMRTEETSKRRSEKSIARIRRFGDRIVIAGLRYKLNYEPDNSSRGRIADSLLKMAERDPIWKEECKAQFGENYRAVLLAYVYLSEGNDEGIPALRKDAFPAIDTAVLRDNDIRIREKAVQLLAYKSIIDPGSAEILDSARKDGRNFKIHEGIYRTLAILGDKYGIDFFIGQLASDRYDEYKGAGYFLQDLGYEFKKNKEGLSNPREVDVSVFRRVPVNPREYNPFDQDQRIKYMHTKVGTVKVWMGKKRQGIQRRYSVGQRIEGKQGIIMRMTVNFLGLGRVEVLGDTSKLAVILKTGGAGVDEKTEDMLRSILSKIKDKYGSGIFGAATQIVLVDNLGGLESNLPDAKGDLAVFQDRYRIVIDIDAFRSEIVLFDVVLHELWHSMLRIVEGDKGVEEAAAIYQSLLYFVSLDEDKKKEMIKFLSKGDNGLDSRRYAELLEKVKKDNLKGEALIPAAIGYVLAEPRYFGIQKGLRNGIEQEIINKVKDADKKVRALIDLSSSAARGMDEARKIEKVEWLKVKKVDSEPKDDGSEIQFLEAKRVNFMVIERVKFRGKIYWAKFVSRDFLYMEDDFIAHQADILNYINKKGIQNICRAVYFLQVEAGRKLILFEELPPGKTLADRTNERHKRARSKEKRFIEIIYKAACILRELHRVGVYHWDIKPENIWVADNGEVILIDFDFAFGSREEFEMLNLASAGTQEFKSKRRYAERLPLNEAGVFPPAEDEIFSLAMALYMVLGVSKSPPPYVVVDDYIEREKDISPRIKRILHLALDDGECRYKTADEFIKALESVLGKKQPTKLREILNRVVEFLTAV